MVGEKSAGFCCEASYERVRNYFNISLQHISSCNISRQHATTTFYDNMLLQHFTTTCYCKISLQHATATFYDNMLLQHFAATNYSNSLLHQHIATTCGNKELQTSKNKEDRELLINI